ncbi:alpha/beta fold hydrolase [Luteibacter aegosomatissinici]|uniref:alpha/beta fold hydrolase n=1 Tax=Luteibacter aegosomatissinici TaxID=2911539 RepID=UPI001FF7A631|nr:alpha/beta fold hydrolase [Luteibacter aegosomatissinici]UPG92575.1 alpha/beta fold hydrolase [Luteibacter aegosomatissinici]
MTTLTESRPLIHASEKGSLGPTLVFLHYYGGSARTWSGVIAGLPADQHTIAVDFRGWGQSERTAEGHTLHAYADDVQAILAARGVTDFVLVGHSMGGKVAQLIASRQPAGLRRLVLVAPATPTPLALPAEVLAGFASVYDSRESIEGALENMLVAQPLPERLHEQVVADSLGGAPAAKAAWPLSISQEDISEAIAHINVPTLVLSGSDDKVDPTDTLKANLLPLLPHAELKVLPGHGHLLPLEAPAEVAALIAASLRPAT